jgi:hypothetical protein
MVKLKYVFAALILFLPWSAAAQVQVSSKHMMVLYPSVDSVFGSYIFMVQNQGQQPERYSFPVMLPVETIDFQAASGLAPNELNLGADRGLTIDKVFPPGDTLITIGFKIPAEQGAAPLTLKATTSAESVGFFVYEGQFQISGPTMDIRRAVEFSGRPYDTYTLSDLKAGSSYALNLQGIPEGRNRLWWIGWIAGAVMLMVAGTLAWMSRPKLPDGADVTI